MRNTHIVIEPSLDFSHVNNLAFPFPYSLKALDTLDSGCRMGENISHEPNGRSALEAPNLKASQAWQSGEMGEVPLPIPLCCD